MKKLLTGLLLIVSTFSFAQEDIGVGGLAQEFKQQLTSKMELTKSLLQVQISNRELDFSDYREASQDLLERIDASQKKLASSMNEIEDFISLYEKIHSSQTNRAMERLFEQKKKEIQNLRNIYQNVSKSYIGLGGHLDIPLQDRIGGVKYTRERWGNYSNSSTEVSYLFDKRIYEAEYYMALKSYHIQELTHKLHGAINSTASRLFGKCKTQGCVYYLAEDIMLWLKESQKQLSSLDIPVEGTKDFNGASFSGSTKKVRDTIDDLADIEAMKLPTTL